MQLTEDGMMNGKKVLVHPSTLIRITKAIIPICDGIINCRITTFSKTDFPLKDNLANANPDNDDMRMVNRDTQTAIKRLLI